MKLIKDWRAYYTFSFPLINKNIPEIIRVNLRNLREILKS
jgi:hypothetical protein